MNNKQVDEINEILARELGRAPDGGGRWRWDWSEDLFWPAYATGKMVERVIPSDISRPCAACNGSGTIHLEWADATIPCRQCNASGKITGIVVMENEYVCDRMTDRRDAWVVTTWLDTRSGNMFPSERDWDRMFPGACYPGEGYRVKIDYEMDPGQTPFLQHGGILDSVCHRAGRHVCTEYLIQQVRHQLGNTFQRRTAEQVAQLARHEAAKDSKIRDMAGDVFTAWLNPFPGKRGGNVAPQAGIGDSPIIIQKENEL